MSVTPRRPPLASRPQGVHTHAPRLLNLDLDKSPSLALRSFLPTRSSNSKSTLLPPPLKSTLTLIPVPATAPARVPAHKRAREDTHYEDTVRAAKRTRMVTPVKEKKIKPQHTKDEREERQKELENFVDKYTRAFPTFSFYFDSLDSGAKSSFAPRIRQLGGHVADFFSGTVTHVITNKSYPKGEELKTLQENKENRTAPSTSRPLSKPPITNSLRSPIKLKALTGKSGLATHEKDSSNQYDSFILKVVQLGIKLWDADKLDMVLIRLQQPVSKPKLTTGLSYLLETERQSGLTYERDPTALRRDYVYFGRNSYFLLVEDLSEEHCPIAVKEYGRWRDGMKGSPPWPVLRDAPGRARKGWAEGKVTSEDEEEPEEDEEMETDVYEEAEDAEEVEDEALEPASNDKGNQLRRTASMHNIGRTAMLKRDAEFIEGLPGNNKVHKLFNQKAYAAASGNSVSITSNVNSTTSFLPPPVGVAPQKAMSRKLHKQVLTHRTFSKMQKDEDGEGVEEARKATPVLRKSKSTNTVRLAFREETKKPGYCENCKYKFSDFKTHVKGQRHAKWASDERNFWALDDLLSRLERKTLKDVEEAERAEAEEMDVEGDEYGEEEYEAWENEDDGY